MTRSSWAGAGSAPRRDDPEAIVVEETGFVGCWLTPGQLADQVIAHVDWVLPDGSAGPGPGLRGRRALRSCGSKRTGPAAVRRTLCPTSWRSGCDERVRRDDPRPSSGIRPGRSYDVVIIGGGGHGLATAYYLATRHGITNVAVLEANYIALGQLRPQHDDHPGELRHPRVDPLLPAQPGPVSDARGRRPAAGSCTTPRASCGWPTPRLAMRAERARCLLNVACGAETVMVTPEEARTICPAARPVGRRPLPGPGRLVPRRGGHGPPRSGRVGLRPGRAASAGSMSSSTRR